MKVRYRLIYRGERGSTFYCVDSETGKRFSLQTKVRDTAEQIVLAKNQALRQPTLNLQIAKAYLAGTDSGVATRTWQDALIAIVETKHGPTKERWLRAAKDKALDGIRKKTIIETQAEGLLEALKAGTVSTNVHLRKLHNFLSGHELAALATDSQTALAGNRVSSQTCDHVGRTPTYCWPGAEPGTAGLL